MGLFDGVTSMNFKSWEEFYIKYAHYAYYYFKIYFSIWPLGNMNNKQGEISHFLHIVSGTTKLN